MAELLADHKTGTLYDDWQARRELLASAPGEPSEYRAVEIRLLDYLIRRYQDSPEAARLPLFPLPTSAFINHRAIVVHHHLGRGSIPTISNRSEAYAHVRTMTEHIWASPETEHTSVAEEETPAFVVPPKIDPVEEVREKLCDADPAVRVRAAAELGEIGSLDDIGLLSDLLSLPFSLDEHPQERAALLHAMQRLSGMTEEKFDLSGVKPTPPVMTPLGSRGLMKAELRQDFYPDSNYYFIMQILAGVMFVIGGMLLIMSLITALARN